MFKLSTSLSGRVFSTTSRKMGKSALVFLAPGAEEMEFVISVDVLRRGGVNVTVAGVPDKTTIKCSRDILITPDIAIKDVTEPYDALVLPGGLVGSKNLSESTEVASLMKRQQESGRIIAAICAAPLALKAHGIFKGKNITSYPSVEQNLMEGDGYVYKQNEVVIDGNLITSRGPGTAYKFALAILEKLEGEEKAAEVAKGMLLSY